MTPSNANKFASPQRSGKVRRGLFGAFMLVSLGGVPTIAAAQQPNMSSPPQSPYFAQHAEQAGVNNCAAAYHELGAMVAQGGSFDMGRTTINRFGNAVATAAIARMSGDLPETPALVGVTPKLSIQLVSWTMLDRQGLVIRLC